LHSKETFLTLHYTVIKGFYDLFELSISFPVLPLNRFVHVIIL